MIWKSIIRPPRENYSSSSLGPRHFAIRNRNFKRNDLVLQNSRGLKLQCSHFMPVRKERVCSILPCVIYLHCNAGSRLESLISVKRLLPANITVFTFDFAGCGMSEGDFITLGWYEQDDLKTVVEYLRQTGKVSYIGLCGRSMGAVTAILYGATDPSIAAIIADSPFSSLKQVIKDQAKKYSIMPGFIISAARKLVKKTIMKKTGFDIDLLDILEYAKQCYIPILFCHGNNDNFISSKHTEKLLEVYAGEKDRIIVEGDHNSPRPKYFLDSVAIFFYNSLQCEALPPPISSKKLDKSMKFVTKINLKASSTFQRELNSQEELIKSYRKEQKS